MTRPRRVARCARCGHAWKKHQAPGSECFAVVGWESFSYIRWEPALCPCGCFRKRQTGVDGGYAWKRLFEAESLLLVSPGVIECPACRAHCAESDITNSGVCRFCNRNIISLLDRAV